MYPPRTSAYVLDENYMNQSDFSLHGCHVCLTGATGHLGRAMAKGLAAAGATVILTARNPERLAHVTQTLKEERLSVDFFPCELTSAESRTELAAFLEERIPRLDVLVNNAHGGVSAAPGRTHQNDIEHAQSIAVGAPFDLVHKTLPLLQKSAETRRGGASVVNISSMYGWVSPDPRIYGDSGLNSPLAYGAAKAGMLQMTRYLAVHLAHHKVRVNAITPGPFPKNEIQRAQPEFCETLTHKVPLGRLGDADELLGPVVFLASDASSFVTGVNLPVDGGWTAW